MRFIADSMLGKLARWLRVYGFDALYYRETDNDRLIRAAIEEKRILLTRDTRIKPADGLSLFFIRSDFVDEQIREVLRNYPPPGEDALFSRCLLCNIPLEKVDKADVRDRIPPFVFKNRDEFSICPGCKKIYWAGTHYAKMKEKLQDNRAF